MCRRDGALCTRSGPPRTHHIICRLRTYETEVSSAADCETVSLFLLQLYTARTRFSRNTGVRRTPCWTPAVTWVVFVWTPPLPLGQGCCFNRECIEPRWNIRLIWIIDIQRLWSYDDMAYWRCGNSIIVFFVPTSTKPRAWKTKQSVKQWLLIHYTAHWA